MAQASSIDDYIRSFPEDVRVVLEKLRRSILDVVPAAEGTISYQMPTFKLDGKHLVYFAGWKQHISVYPVPKGDAAFEREIEPYLSGKGTLRFPLSQPIPYDLIKRLVGLLARQRIEHAG